MTSCQAIVVRRKTTLLSPAIPGKEHAQSFSIIKTNNMDSTELTIMT
jgi:hypothetical protein